MKIGVKISLTFFLVAVILATTATVISYKITENNLKNSIFNNMATVAEAKSRHIEMYLKMIREEALQMSKSAVLEVFLKTPKTDSSYAGAFEIAMTRLKRTQEANPSIYEYLLLDENGKVVASSDASSIGRDKSSDPFFLRAQKGTYIKDAYFSEDKKMPLMAVASPVKDSLTGKFLGVVVARITLNELYRITMNRVGLGDTGEIIIINKYGFLITPSRFLKDTFLKKRIETLNSRECLKHLYMPDEGYKNVINPDYRGVEALTTHSYIRDMGWGVLTKIDMKEALAPVNNIKITAIIILILVPFIAWAMGSFAAHLITKPLHELHRGTEIIGSGNLDYKVGSPARDEIGQLSRAFDAMTDDLKKKIGTIGELDKEITARKKAEELVSKAAKLWSATFDAMPEGISVHEIDGTVINANLTLCRMLKKSRAEVIGKKCYELFHGKDVPIKGCPMHAVRDKKEKVYAELFEPFLNRWIGVSVSPIFDDTGEVAKVVHVVSDITERKLAEERIHKINRMQVALLGAGTPKEKYDMITNGVVNIFDADFCRIWLISPGDRCQKGCIHAQAKEEAHLCRMRDKCLHLVSSSGRYTHTDGGAHARVPFGCYKIGGIASGEYPSFLTNNVLSDPRVHNHEWAERLGLVSFAGIQLRSPDAGVIGVLALFSKKEISSEEYALLENISNVAVRVTQSIAKEKVIIESEEKFKTMFESSKDAIMMLAPDGKFFDANAATMEMFGCKDKEQFISLGPSDLSPEFQPDGRNSREKAQEMMSIAMDKGSYFFEWKHKRIDGSEFFATVLLTRMEIKGRQVLQATVRDITELKELESMKDEFVGMVSHELRTPLTALKESIAIVLDGLSGPINDEQKDFLTTAKRNIDRLGRLINDILDYQRLEAGRMIFNMQGTNINALIEEVANTMMPSASAKGLTLATRLDESLPAVILDKDKIMEVVINLVNNAIKFTDKGSITVSTERKDSAVMVSVRDTGIGMKHEDIPKLFRGFAQLDAGRMRKKGSTGLGLAISKKIVQEHRGDIWVESQEGKGSDFKFKLPLKTKYKVLLIDNNKELLNSYSDFLKQKGFDTAAYDRGMAALASIKAERPDMVVLDICIKDMNGREVIGRLRSDKDTIMMPILVVSEDAEDKKNMGAKQSEMAIAFLSKPFEMGALLSAVKLLLRC